MYLGNLKSSAEPLPVDTATLEQLKLEIGDRPVWLAASTHPGEESIIAAVYQSLKLEWENLLLIIVPRHPTRGAEVVHDLKILGLNSTLRSIGEKPTGEIYVADTLGELGLFYRLARVAFIGGSMFSHGGHNPLEAALLGCVAVLGPDMNNFSSVAQELLDAKGAVQCSNSDDMGKTIGSLLRDEEYRSRFAAAATHVAIDNADAATRFHGEVIRLLKGNYG